MFKLAKNKMFLVIGALIFTAAAVFLLTTCDVGLGMKVNTDKPSFRTPEDSDAAPGAFLVSHKCDISCPEDCELDGKSRVNIEIPHEVGIRSAFITVSFKPNPEKQALWPPEWEPERGWVQAVFDAKQIPGTVEWYVDLPTELWLDGKFLGVFTATDISGNTTSTPDIVYFVKNTPPQIELTIPAIKDKFFDLLFDKNHSNTVLSVNQGNPIMGIAFDDLGFEAGYPQIMIWPAGQSFVPDGLPAPWLDTNDYTTGVPQDGVWGVWHTVEDNQGNKVNEEGGLTSMQFRWNLYQYDEDGLKRDEDNNPILLPRGEYNVRLRVKDLHGRYNYYPDRVNYSTENIEYDYDPDGVIIRKRFMTIQIVKIDTLKIVMSPFNNSYNGDPAHPYEQSVQVLAPNPSVISAFAKFSHVDDVTWTGFGEEALTPISTNDGTTDTVSFKIEVSRTLLNQWLGENIAGDKFLHVRAQDAEGNEISTSRQVIIDVDPPDISFIEPLQRADQRPYVTSTVLVRGNLSDDQRVARMWYALGDVPVNTVVAQRPGWNISMDEKTRWIDLAPSSAHWIDSDLHQPPPSGVPASEAEKKIHPSPSDLAAMGLNPPPPALSHIQAVFRGSLSSWSWRFENIAQVMQGNNQQWYVIPLDPLKPEDNLWRLPISFKIQDQAGNIRIERIELIVDPDADKPKISINSHTDQQTVGGPITLRGIAEDNEMIAGVEMRIIMQHTSEVNGPIAPSWLFNEDDPVNLVHNPGPEAGWKRITVPNHNAAIPIYTSMVSWVADVNSKGELSPPGPSDIRQVRFEFRAIDSPATFDPNLGPPEKSRGPVQSILLLFDNTVPVIENEIFFEDLPSVIGHTNLIFDDDDTEPPGSFKFSAGVTKVRGKVTKRITIRDESGMSFVRIRSGNHTAELMTNGNINTPYSTLNDVRPWMEKTANFKEATRNPITGDIITYGEYEYYIFIPMNTNVPSGNSHATEFGSNFQHQGNVFNYNLQILDITEPAPLMAQNNYSLEIDNRYPLATFTGSRFARGSNYRMEGMAWDTGTDGTRVQGVDRIVLYLTRIENVNNERIINLSGTNVNQALTNPVTTQSAWRGRVGTTNTVENDKGNVIHLPLFPELGAGLTTSDSGIVIGGGNTGNHELTTNKGTTWSGSTFIEWGINFDTTQLTDGKYSLFYVVFDTVGNATQYEENIYIGNKNPVITSISLGTDADFSGSVSSDEFVKFGTGVDNTNVGSLERTTRFRVRNNSFALQIETDSQKGNGQKYYRVSYVTRNLNPVDSTALVQGNVYTIRELGDLINWTDYGVFGTAEVGTTFVAVRNASVNDLVQGANAGSVWSYTGRAANTVQSGQFAAGGSGVNVSSYTAAAFGASSSTTAIQESTGITLDNVTGEITWDGKSATAADSQKRFFLVHVFDSTVTGASVTNWNEQLSAVALLNVGINNIDGFAPRIEFAEFGKKIVPSAADENNYILRTLTTDLTKDEYTYNVVSENTATPARRDWKGYVQYRAHDPESNDELKRANISGMVILNGKAMDNSRIRFITAEISDGTTMVYNFGAATQPAAPSGVTYQNNRERPVAAWSTNRLEPSNMTAARTALNTIDAADRPDNWQEVSDNCNLNTIAAMRLVNTIPYGFTSEKAAVTMEYGHVLNWSFAWDSSTVTNIARNNITITIRVYDTATAALFASTSTTVNIVPYITEIVTQLSGAVSSNPSTFNRSALGWYPVRENEVIEIKGFNLGAATGTQPSVNIGEADAAATPTFTPTTNVNNNVTTTGQNWTTGVNTNIRVNSSRHLSVRVDNNDQVGADGSPPAPDAINNITSGPLVVTVNGITSFNNRNSIHTNAHYNNEPNVVNNNILKDDRYLYVWNTGWIVNHNNMNSPVMRISSTGDRFVNFGTFFTNRGELKLYRNNVNLSTAGAPATGTAAAQSTVANQQNRYFYNNFALNGNDWTAISSNITSGQAGLLWIYNNYEWNTSNAIGSGVRRRLMTLGDDPFRVKSPSIAFQDGGTNIAMGYFDTRSTNQQLTINFTNNAGAGLHTADLAAPRANRAIANNASATKAKSGQYISVGILSGGRAVAAWYDQTAQCLWFSYVDTPSWNSENNTAPSMASWQNNAVIIKEGAGTHVDMVVSGDNIHLAYVDTRNGGLWYSYIPVSGGVPQSKANASSNTSLVSSSVKTVRVDTYLAAGTRLMLNVRDGKPYISYVHNAFAETRHSARVAWPKHTISSSSDPLHGTNTDHTFTGDWEVMTVPALNVPDINEYISNGVPAARGTGTDDTGRWVAPANLSGATQETLRGWTTATGTTAYANTIANQLIHQTILVGYMTTDRYEGAMLKYNILNSRSQ